MREIKFRAWDKHLKGWVVETVLVSDSFAYIIRNHQLVALYAEIMQFTGLKDKNGIEIFEGDWLKHDLWGVSEVIWDNESACFRGKNDEHDITLAHHQLLRSKVIGNIYEDKGKQK